MSSASLRRSEPAGFSQEDSLAQSVPAIMREEPVEKRLVEWPMAIGEAGAARDPDWPDEPSRAANDDVPQVPADVLPEVTPGDPVWSGTRSRGAGRWAATSLFSAILHVAVGSALLAAGADLVLVAGGGEPDLARIGNAEQDSKAGASAATELVVKFEQAQPDADSAPAAIETSPLPAAASGLVRTPPVVNKEQTLPEALPEASHEPMREPVARPEPAETAQAIAAAATPEPEEKPEPKPEDKLGEAAQPSHEAPPVPAAPTVAEDTPEAADDLPELTQPRPLPAVLPVPEPAPRAPAERRTAAKTPPPPGKAEPFVEKKAEQPARSPAAKRAERKATRQQRAAENAAEARGNAAADARRGVRDGAARSQSSSSSRRKGASGPGDAATSNYPGLVLSRLRQALRYPNEASGTGMRGEARVRFTIASNGSASRIKLVRSSGFPALDKAALETVRRASPFPAIPSGAGRSNWTFTAPLMFSQ